MDKSASLLMHRIAEAASAFHHQGTGHWPRSVSAVLGPDTLVVTLHGALSPAEQLVAQSESGAAQVQEFHRQLFANSVDSLRRELAQLIGTDVSHAAAEFPTNFGSAVHAFSNGTMVQVFLLKSGIPPTSLDKGGAV